MINQNKANENPRGRRNDDAGGAPATDSLGKFRGKVETNVDPMYLGRIEVSVPAVGGCDTHVGCGTR